MKTKRIPEFQCMECGKAFYTVQAAERARDSDRGCPKCGGVDIDIFVNADEGLELPKATRKMWT